MIQEAPQAAGAAEAAGATGPVGFTGARWRLRPADPAAVRALCQRHGVSEAVATVAAGRGLDLSPDWLQPGASALHDPYAMANMGAAVARLRLAAQRGERVRLITDYDVDGTTSSLILRAALGLALPSLTVEPYIPDRFTEGYGFSVAAAQAAARDGAGLIVTADVGVRDHAAVRAARDAGVDVLIADHHLPDGADVPDGATVLCPPQRGCAYPNRFLAACGVATKLATALLEDDPRRDRMIGSLLKLAAIGTVADLVPVTSTENRAILRLGLEGLNAGGHAPGLAALLEVAGLSPGSIGEEDLGFRVGPRINAAGRVAHAGLVLDLLTARDPARARQLAQELDGLNQERRAVQARLAAAAEVELVPPIAPFVVVAGAEVDGWHRGVVGIVASKLRERLHRPVAVVSIDSDLAVGSVRSVPGVHAVRALDHAADLLVRYGGHPAAAGFTVPTAQLDALRARLVDYVERHAAADALLAVHEADAAVPAAALSWALHEGLRALGPFGQGHTEPLLLVRGARLRDVRALGADGRHVKARIDGTPDGAEAVWWGRGDLRGALDTSGPVDLLGRLAENSWKGRRTLQLVLTDARPAAAETGPV